jgi:phage terminase small subunit
MNQKRGLSSRQREFARQFLTNLAQGKSRGFAATAAAKAVGYKGSSIAPNARRLTQDQRVKDYIYSLTRPEEVAAEAQVTATVDEAKQRLSEVVLADIDLSAIKPTDKIAAVRELSLINGWHAPKRTELTGKDGAPIETAARYEITDVPMSDEEWSKQYATEKNEPARKDHHHG